MAKLIDITGKAISGEWGTDDLVGNGVPVLRTTNFTNIGVVNFNNVVTRQIVKKSISEKLLRYGDIIIEKSGGSDKQPVGRVVFFEGEDNKYLFNNFTGLLRVRDFCKWNPKYIFYSLFANYAKGGTIPFENRTTGLHNLQTDSYVNSVMIVERKIEEQTGIVTILDKVNQLINYEKKQLEDLDILVKSRFIEMFGESNYPLVKACDVCDFITKGTTPNTKEIYENYTDERIPFLKVYNLSNTGKLLFKNKTQYIDNSVHNGELSRSIVFPNDVLMNIVGPPLGKFALVDDSFPEWNVNQAIAIFRAKREILPLYLLYSLMQDDILSPFLQKAVGVRQLNISLEQCRELQFRLPPLNLQHNFSVFAQQVDKSKLAIQQSLDELETLKKSLMQQYFG